MNSITYQDVFKGFLNIWQRLRLRRLVLPVLVIAALLLLNSFQSIRSHTELESLVGLGKLEEASLGFAHKAEQTKVAHEAALLWFQAAELAEMLHKDELALSYYQQLILADPLADLARQAREQRALLYEKLGDFDALLHEYSELIKYYPQHEKQLWYRLRIAEGFLMAKRFAAAEDELAEIYQLAADDEHMKERILFDWAEVHFLAAQPKLAVKAYQKFLKHFPNSVLAGEAKLKLASSVEALGYLGSAFQLAEEAREIYPHKEVVDLRLKSMSKRAYQLARTD